MPFAPLIDETRRLELEAEQALERAPLGTADHESVQLLVVELRALLARLLDAKSDSDSRIRSTLDMIDSARTLLAELQVEASDSN